MILSLKDFILGKLKPLKFIFHKMKFSVVIVPQTSTSKFKSRTLSFPVFLLTMLLYSLAVFFISGALLIYTPARNLFFSENVSLTYRELRDNELMVEKVNRLIRELDDLKITNERLRKAILMGDSTAFMNLEKKPPKSNKGVKPAEGNIFGFVFGKIFPEAQSVNLSFIKPLDGYISNKFNPDKGHYGIDIAAKAGTPISASANGYVVFAAYTVQDGYMVILAHAGDQLTFYKHCADVLVKPRQRVTQGDPIALCGNTGMESKGSHLHFEIWRAGSAMDPLLFF